MTKIRIMRSWEKQEEKRLKEFEEKRNNAPFKNWIAPAVQEAIESGNYEYIAMVKRRKRRFITSGLQTPLRRRCTSA